MSSRTAKNLASLCLVVPLAALVGGAPVQAVPAPTLTIEGTSTATSNVGTSIVVGDVFTWSVTFDLDSPSTSAVPSFGHTFNDAILAFSVEAAADNVGSWDPTGVVWPITPAANVSTNANSDAITVQLQPQNAPDLDSVAFFDLELSIDWDASDLDAVWQQGPTTLATWLGTTTPPLEAAALYFGLRDTSFASGSFNSVLDLPTTPTPLLPPPPPATTTPPTTTPSTTTVATTIAPTTTTAPATTVMPAITTTVAVPRVRELDAAMVAAAPGLNLGAPEQVNAEDQVTLMATGFTPGAAVEVYLASTPRLVASTTADDVGVVTVVATIPLGYVGTHSLVLYEPATGLLQRQIVDIAGPVLPATGPFHNTTTVLAALMAVLIGVVLLTRSGRQRPECPNPPPR